LHARIARPSLNPDAVCRQIYDRNRQSRARSGKYDVHRSRTPDSQPCQYRDSYQSAPTDSREKIPLAVTPNLKFSQALGLHGHNTLPAPDAFGLHPSYVLTMDLMAGHKGRFYSYVKELMGFRANSKLDQSDSVKTTYGGPRGVYAGNIHVIC
jgi:hypothetical protein